MDSFYNRSKLLAEGIIRQRLYLISTDNSHKVDNDNIRIKAELLREKLNICMAKLTMAHFIVNNYTELDNLIIGGNKYQEKSKKLKELKTESEEILNNHCSINGIKTAIHMQGYNINYGF